jgi:hypothetical protein
MLMAGVPTAPPTPTYISSTDTSITVQFYTTSNSNGSPITSYEVWRDLGDGMSEMTHKETTYDGSSMQFTLSGLTPGKVYKIANKAFNNIGSSAFSDYVMIGATLLPDPPGQIYKVSQLSSKTALTVSWDKSADPKLPITGYLL